MRGCTVALAVSPKARSVSGSSQVEALLSALSERDAQLAEAQSQKEALKSENARLWKAYEQLKGECPEICVRVRWFLLNGETDHDTETRRDV
jgi:predicted nuclease with TOPRIM domain